MHTLASRIQARRTELGLTQQALARRAGVAKTTIASLEQERAKTTTFLVPIAKALGVREEWLVSGKGKKEAGMEPAAGEQYYLVAKSPEEAAEQLLAKGDDAVLQLLAAVMKLKEGKGG